MRWGPLARFVYCSFAKMPLWPRKTRRRLLRSRQTRLSRLHHLHISGSLFYPSHRRVLSVTSLEEVYGGIAFYLANRAQMDEYLRESEREFVRLRNESRAKNPALYERPRSMLESKRSVKS